eukprot:scaffold1900_cov389-Prasinococcus_capsulatus_cf.AAC.26
MGEGGVDSLLLLRPPAQRERTGPLPVGKWLLPFVGPPRTHAPDAPLDVVPLASARPAALARLRASRAHLKWGAAPPSALRPEHRRAVTTSRGHRHRERHLARLPARTHAHARARTQPRHDPHLADWPWPGRRRAVESRPWGGHERRLDGGVGEGGGRAAMGASTRIPRAAAGPPAPDGRCAGGFFDRARPCLASFLHRSAAGGAGAQQRPASS